MRRIKKLAIAVAMTVAGFPSTQTASDSLYFCDASGINRAGLDGSDLSLVMPLGVGCYTFFSVDVDVVGGKIYFSWGCPVGPESGIARTDLEGESFEYLVSHATYTYAAVVFDPSNRKIYWTRSDQYANQGLVERSAVDPFVVEPVVSQAGTVLGGVDVDPVARKVYWTVFEFGGVGTGRVRQADFDGQNVEDLITGLDEPHDLALDLVGRKIYWTDVGTGMVQRGDMANGQNVENVASGLSAPIGLDVDRDTNKVYWAELVAGRIQRANLDGSAIETVLSGLVEPSGVRVVDDTPTAARNLEAGGLEVRVLRARDHQAFTFAVAVPHDGWLILDVYTVTGRHLSQLVNKYTPAGVHRVPWDGTRSDGGPAPSGVYFYRLEWAAREHRAGKLLIMR